MFSQQPRGMSIADVEGWMPAGYSEVLIQGVLILDLSAARQR